MDIEYPPAPRSDAGDDYHGEFIADPFRWLEETDSPETAAWVKGENELTEAWLSAVPSRDEILERLSQLWNFPRFGVPYEAGGRWFESRNTGLQNQAVWYVSDDAGADGRLLLDPNLLSEDGTVAISSLAPSFDGTLLAYATSQAGSDWTTWQIRDVRTGTDLPDVIPWSKFSEASWRADGSGFFYGSPDAPEPGREYEAETRHLRLRFHRLGDDPVDDEVVFEPAAADWLPHASVTDDGRYLVVSISRGTNRESRVEIKDLDAPDEPFVVIAPDFSVELDFVGNSGRRFFFATDEGAPRRQLVAVDLLSPGAAEWERLVPEQDDTLVGAKLCGSSLVCWYLADACSRMRVYDLAGTFVREVPLPPHSSLVEGDWGTVSGGAGRNRVHFAVTGFLDSGSIYSHELDSGETRIVRQAAAPFDSEAFVTERTFATSADGTKVPLFLSRRRDLEKHGDAPALLYGYGGFSIPVVPGFSPEAALFMERGGIYAVANLRGGGEFGRSWHDGGRLAHKQHVFDDFIACARHLADSHWTRKERVVLNGRSNGGLLVGACLTQFPDEIGAAVPEVGVHDMLRFHKFTIGWAWTSDFGSPDDPEQYRWLRAYSPLHNIRPGTAYPPTLVMTGDHDDRVVPGHSFKFGAALQQAQGGDAPILVRIDTSAGHGLGKPTAKRIKERADVLTFIEGALGLSPREEK